METVLLIVHILAAAGIIGLVLLQQGKGADMGAAFGAGASATVFGSQGSASFLTRSTAILATVFFITSISLAALSASNTERSSVTDSVMPTVVVPAADDLPAAPEKSAAESDVPSAANAGTEPKQ